MHYLPSVYFVNQPLQVPGIFVAHHQEVYHICVSGIFVAHHQEVYYIRGLLEKYPTVFFYANT